MPRLQHWSPPISDAFDVFRLHCQAQRYSPKTVEFYDNRVPRFVAWLAERGITELPRITANHIRAYLVERQDGGASAHYLHGIARALRTWLSFCATEGWLETSPAQAVKMPKLPRDALPAFDDGELKAIMRVAATERDRAMVLFLLDTGLRASELLALTGGDVDIRTGAVTVQHGKGDKRRTVYAGSKTVRALLRYYAVRGQPPANGAVWLTEREPYRALTYTGLAQLLRRIGVAAKTEVTAHKFRRTFALQCLRNGMDVYSLQRLMGHEDLTVLQRYLALASSDIETAHRKHGVVDNL